MLSLPEFNLHPCLGDDEGNDVRRPLLLNVNPEQTTGILPGLLQEALPVNQPQGMAALHL